MNIRALMNDLPLYLRAMRLSSEVRLRVVARQTLLASAAVAIAVMALVFLNIAAYQAMVLAWGPIWTPAILGLGNGLLAAILLAIALRARPGAELAMAEELQKAALARLQEDVSGPGEGLGGLGGEQLRYVVPILSMVIGALRKARKPEAK